MDTASDRKQVETLLLKELNQNRAKDGKAPLSQYPEVGCTSCGELPDSSVPLFGTSVPYVRTCQPCVLKQIPFNKLKLSADEKIEWYRSNPTFHRSTDYGIVITDRAVYLYAPFWLMFARWRTIPREQLRGATFRDSRLFPALHIEYNGHKLVLRTPPDYADEMKYDRRNLAEAEGRLRALISGAKK